MSENVIERLRHCAEVAPSELCQVYPGDVVEMYDALQAAQAPAPAPLPAVIGVDYGFPGSEKSTAICAVPLEYIQNVETLAGLVQTVIKRPWFHPLDKSHPFHGLPLGKLRLTQTVRRAKKMSLFSRGPKQALK